MFTEIGHLIYRELYLIESCFAEGLNALAKATRKVPSLYYVSSFNLSTSIERLAKLHLLISKMLETGDFPTQNYLKTLSHDLIKLMEQTGTSPLEGTLEKDILRILSRFAKQTRYENLDSLTTNNSTNDFLIGWNEIYDKAITFDPFLKRAAKLHRERSTEIANLISPFTVTMASDILGQSLSTENVLNLSADTKYSRYLAWKVICLVKPLRDSLTSLAPHGWAKKPNSDMDIPYLSEIMADMDYYSDRSNATKKKSWGQNIRKGINGGIH